MKITKEFKKIASLASSIRSAKEEAKKLKSSVDKERQKLDNLEDNIKSVLRI